MDNDQGEIGGLIYKKLINLHETLASRVNHLECKDCDFKCFNQWEFLLHMKDVHTTDSQKSTRSHSENASESDWDGLKKFHIKNTNLDEEIPQLPNFEFLKVSMRKKNQKFPDFIFQLFFIFTFFKNKFVMFLCFHFFLNYDKIFTFMIFSIDFSQAN